MANLKNYTDNTVVSGTGSNDYIYNSGDRVSINAYAGNDSITNSEGANTSIVGGEGNDSITNADSDNVTILAGADDDYIYNLRGSFVSINGGQGKDTFDNCDNSNVTITAGDGDDEICNYYGAGDYVKINGGAGNDSVKNCGSNATINGGDGSDTIINDSYYNDNECVIITADAGDDSIGNSQNNVSINGGQGKDTIRNYNSFEVTIDAGTGDDYIYNESENSNDVTIAGGSGKDSIFNREGDSVTINAGIGNDLISLYSWAYDNMIVYNEGDGKDKIYGFDEDDTLKISGSSYSTAESGDNVIITVGKGKISLFGALAYVSPANIDFKKTKPATSWKLDGTTATYGSLTIKGVTSLDGISLDGKVVTISAASLGTEKVSVSDGYTLKLGKDVSSSTTKKSWSLSGTIATYKQTTSAGYSLEDNKIIYSKKASKTLATVKGVNDKSGLKVSGKTIKLSGDALSKKVTVSGAYTFDFANDFKNATITGSSSNDTIIARGKKVFVKGGAGADIFQFKSTGTVGDYEEADKISLTSAAEISVSGSDVIFGGKITVASAANKSITYIEDGEEKIFKKASDDVKYNADGTGATLTAKYTADEFTPNEYSDFANMLKTIDASAVDYNLKIVGNKRANKITGGEEDDFIDGAAASDKIFGADGNDTLVGGKGNDCLSGGAGDDSLWGGAGSDTLFGGDGSDTFVYKSGDGSIIIEDFDDSLDKIRVLSGDVNSPTVDNAGDVTFAVGEGEIVVKGGADKFIPIYFGKGNKNIVMKYNPR